MLSNILLMLALAVGGSTTPPPVSTIRVSGSVVDPETMEQSVHIVASTPGTSADLRYSVYEGDTFLASFETEDDAAHFAEVRRSHWRDVAP